MKNDRREIFLRPVNHSRSRAYNYPLYKLRNTSTISRLAYLCLGISITLIVLTYFSTDFKMQPFIHTEARVCVCMRMCKKWGLRRSWENHRRPRRIVLHRLRDNKGARCRRDDYYVSPDKSLNDLEFKKLFWISLISRGKYCIELPAARTRLTRAPNNTTLFLRMRCRSKLIRALRAWAYFCFVFDIPTPHPCEVVSLVIETSVSAKKLISLIRLCKYIVSNYQGFRFSFSMRDNAAYFCRWTCNSGLLYSIP